MISKEQECYQGDPPPYEGPAPSAPPLSPPPNNHGRGKPPPGPLPPPRHGKQRSYQMQTESYPAVPNYAVPSNPFTLWKEQFSRNYPDSKMSRDTPSIMKVEVPKNRAFPVMGHATCPDCFDLGPHTKTYIKLKSGLFSHKKHPAQTCRSCHKLAYFIQTSEIALDPAPTHQPPPYVNAAPHTVLHSQPFSGRGGARTGGHGWSNAEQGHGWNDGEGHGWSH